MKRRLLWMTAVLAAGMVTACGEDDSGAPLLPVDSSSPAGSDSAYIASSDTSSPYSPTSPIITDTSRPVDTGTPNTGTPVDTGTPNTGTPVDTGTPNTGASDELAAYVDNGQWHGYLWAALGDQATAQATLVGGTFTGLGGGNKACVSGTLGLSYDDVAMVGWNINQEEGETAKATVTPTGTGVYVDVTNTGGSPLRVQIQTPQGATDANQRWCANLSGSGPQTVPYTEFYTECWGTTPDTKGTQYAGQAIDSVLILVPGDEAAAVSYNFCVNEIREAGGTPVDTGTNVDTGTPVDTGTSVDTGTPVDTGTGVDTASSGTDTGTPPELGTPYTVHDGGYVVSYDWHGFAWTAASGSATVTPDDFSGVSKGDDLCVSGSAPADYDSVGMLGINLNQDWGDNTPLGTLTPTGTGIYVDVQINHAATVPVRLQIQAPDGDTNTDHRWCVNLSNGAQTIPYGEFNTECWDNGGTYYDGSVPLSAALLLVPGDITGVRNFDFCLKEIREVTGTDTDTGSNNSGTITGSGATCAQYGKYTMRRDNVPYLVMNNVWNGGDNTQCIEGDSTKFFEVTQQNGYSGGDAPVSYPSIVYGTKYGDSSANAALPKRINQISSMMSRWAHNAGSASGKYNAAYDIWLNSNGGGDTQPGGAYLMIWHYRPSDVYPIGSAGQAVNIAGRNWTVWSGGTGPSGAPYIAYVANGTVNDLTVDIMDFIDDAVSRGVLNSSMYVANVQAGFEIWSGGTGLKTTDFYVDVQ